MAVAFRASAGPGHGWGLWGGIGALIRWYLRSSCTPCRTCIAGVARSCMCCSETAARESAAVQFAIPSASVSHGRVCRRSLGFIDAVSGVKRSPRTGHDPPHREHASTAHHIATPYAIGRQVREPNLPTPEHHARIRSGISPLAIKLLASHTQLTMAERSTFVVGVEVSNRGTLAVDPQLASSCELAVNGNTSVA